MTRAPFLLLSLLASPLAADELRAWPEELLLDDAADRAGVVVQLERADGTTRDVTAEATLRLDDSDVARVGSGATIVPLADGRTTLVIEHAGLRRELPVRVSGADRARRVAFGRDVLPVLTRAGCNTGSCHGSSRGRDGFHLSLFGYDPAGDAFRITRELAARRIDLALPGESLLLAKATGQVRHTGGRRLEPGGDGHAALMAWLRAGAPPEAADPPRLVRLELRPARSVLVSGSQTLSARAVWDDGSDRDVTALTTFVSSDPSVAAVGSDARLIAGRRGQAFVTARYGEQVVATQVLVVPDDPSYVFPAEDRSAFGATAEEGLVDRFVNARLRRLRLRPAPLVDDAGFLRRVTLDLTGRLPTPEEVESFLADAAPDKRTRAVDRLLGQPAFVEMWAMLWAERLRIRSTQQGLPRKAALGYARWLEERLAAGVPFDRIVRELLTASGGTFENPPASYWQVEEDPKQLAEDAAQAFLGIRLQCAQCHNHPFDRWTQDDYHGFAAFFSQVGRKPGQDPRERIVFDRGRGEMEHPVTKKPVAPRFLGGAAPETKGRERRAVLAEWLTAAENPWFAANVANMAWAHLFGRGIVHEPDDVRVGNPPGDPELLAALAERLASSNWDVRALVREICGSRAYQRAAALDGAGDELETVAFARGQVRRLRAEVLLDAISQATGAPDDLPGLPRGARAIQLQDGASTTDFLTTFGRAARESACTCEVRTTPNLGQALHLLNGDTIQRKLRQGKLCANLLKQTKDPARVVHALWLRTLSRPPTEAELALGVAQASGKDPVAGLEDLLWALLNSREFLFNH